MPAEIGTDLHKAAAFLQEGKLVAIPTETVYGLAANALNPVAAAGIFAAKKRPFFDPLIVHCRSAEHAFSFAAEVPELAGKLAAAFWPGPLTLILPKKDIIPDIITAGNNSVGLRVPAHPMSRELLSLIDFPLAAPSANPFGYISPTSAKHVAEQLGDQVSYILDGGSSLVGLESSIVGFDENGAAEILRLGGISKEEIENVAGKVGLKISTHSNPKAPGQLDSHYAPRIPLWFGDIDELISKAGGKENIGVISFKKSVEGIEENAMKILSPAGDMAEAACNLFAFMRELDKLPLRLIIAEKLPDSGLGAAINDRLSRACEK